MRQAVLERAGWRFNRITGTRFFRDPDRTMEWVLTELERLEVAPSGFGSQPSDEVAVRPGEKLAARARESMRSKGWLPSLVSEETLPSDQDQSSLQL